MNQFIRKGTMVVAGHRGAAALYPENTKIGFQAAIDMGCDMIETDVHLTRNGHIVIMHDESVDRTSNGTGLIADMTLAELRKLDICCKCGENSKFVGQTDRPEFASQQIMTLPEFCEMMKPTDLIFNIEFKTASLACVDAAMAIFQSEMMTGRCVFASFHPSIIAYCHDKYGVQTQGFPKKYFGDSFVEGPKGTFSKMYAVGIGMWDLTPETVQEFVDMGIQPWAWCPDTEEEVRKCRECGVTSVTCNDPRAALKVVKNRVED